MREVTKQAGVPGTVDYDPYFQGMYNGLELALAIMEDREPVYAEAPTKHGRPWLRDVSTTNRRRLKNLFGVLRGRTTSPEVAHG